MPAPTESATRQMPQPISGDGPAGSTADVACREVLPEWPLAGAVDEPAELELVAEGRGAAGFDGACVPVPLPAAGTAVPGWASAAGSAPVLPRAGWPGACPVAGRAGAEPPVAALWSRI